MIRFISMLLLLVGLAAAVYGGMRIYGGEDFAASTPVSETYSEVIPAPETVEPVPEPVARTTPPPLPRSVAIPTERSGVSDERQPRALTRSTEGEADSGGIAAPEPGPMFAPTTMPATPSLSDALKTVPIAYEVPSEALSGKAFDVTLSVDGTGNAEATVALPGEARMIEAEAAVSDRAKANLVGSAFEIEAISPEIQLISPVTQNVWRWRVTPNETGSHRLIIELFAIQDGEALPVRTFNDTVNVSVSRFYQAVSVANAANPIAMVLGGIGSALAGLFGVFRFFKPR